MRRVNGMPSTRDATERIAFPQSLVDAMLQQARSAPQAEICGLVAARRGRPLRCTAIANVAAEPQTRFSMDPQQQIDAFRSMREQGEELYGIYHSHPDGNSAPSHTDIVEAAYPEALQFIVTLHGEAGPRVHAYRFRDGAALPVQLEIGPD